VDETKFPEYYRKDIKIEEATKTTPGPFRVARIISIFTSKTDKKKTEIYLKVGKFYRTEDTQHLKGTDPLDQTLLYWSSDRMYLKYLFYKFIYFTLYYRPTLYLGNVLTVDY
jgi:hypothetical protein